MSGELIERGSVVDSRFAIRSDAKNNFNRNGLGLKRTTGNINKNPVVSNSFQHSFIRPPCEFVVEPIAYLEGFNIDFNAFRISNLSQTPQVKLSTLWAQFKNADKLLVNYLEELVKSAMDKILNPLQVIALIQKIQGATYNEIKKEMNLNDTQVSKILEKTALGIKWDETHNGGRYSVLSSVDKEIFIHKIEDAVSDVNCVATCTARCLVVQLNKNRLKRARYLLRNAGCDQLFKRVTRNMNPDDTWLKKFCSSNGILVVRSQDLEAARRSNCDSRIIKNFFSLYSGLLDRDSRLIFNMDETMMSSRRKFKVLVQAGKLPLVTSQTKFPHITSCVCFSAAGYKTKPLIILPNKATIQKLERYEEYFHIASTISGWMNRDVFFIWCILFVCEISLYRLSLPEEIRHDIIILIVDGHKSRGNYYASKLLSLFKILLLILPGHTSHILQPFDVGIGSPLKASFMKHFLNCKLQGDEEITVANMMNLRLSDIRNMMLECFAKSLDEVLTRENIKSSFKKAGISPVDSNEPLSSDFIFANQNIYNNIKESFLNNKCININDDSLRALFEYDFKHSGSEDELDLSISKIKGLVSQSHKASLENGRLLTKVPDIFDDQGEIIKKIHLED